MIKPNELRIGNLIQCPFDKGGPMQTIIVTGVKDKFITWKSERMFPEEFVLLREDYEGIPLTEEWLGRMGFTRYKRDVNYILSDENHPLDLADTEDWEIFEIKESWFFVGLRQEGFCHVTEGANYDESTGIHKVGRYFKYVHQLQNLFFALSGEELTIKQLA